MCSTTIESIGYNLFITEEASRVGETPNGRQFFIGLKIWSKTIVNSYQLFESSITFICNRTIERIQTLNNMKEKEELFLNIISYFNKEQEEKLREYLRKLSIIGKEEFFNNLVEEGIFIHIPPLWENSEFLFDKLIKLYEEHDWIEQYDVYVNRFGRKIKMMKKLVVGDMYVMKLMQTAKKGFSARSTGSLSRKGLPEKSNKAKTHQELYSKTPIRIGIDENLNTNIGVPTELIAQLHLFYRSSVVGRRDLGENLLTRLNPIKDFKYKPNFKNRNIEILEAFLKSMGLEIEFNNQLFDIEINTSFLEGKFYDGKLFISTNQEFKDIKRRIDITNEYKENKVFVGTNKEFEKLIDEEVRKRKMFTIDIKI